MNYGKFQSSWRAFAATRVIRPLSIFSNAYVRGTIVRSGGTIYLSGVLDNTGSTLQLDDYGSWGVLGGTIRNG